MNETSIDENNNAHADLFNGPRHCGHNLRNLPTDCGTKLDREVCCSANFFSVKEKKLDLFIISTTLAQKKIIYVVCIMIFQRNIRMRLIGIVHVCFSIDHSHLLEQKTKIALLEKLH